MAGNPIGIGSAPEIGGSQALFGSRRTKNATWLRRHVPVVMADRFLKVVVICQVAIFQNRARVAKFTQYRHAVRYDNRARVGHPGAEHDPARSLAYDLVQLASQVVAQDWEPARAAYEADPSNDAARQRFEDEDYALQNIVELMDDMRELKSFADYGR